MSTSPELELQTDDDRTPVMRLRRAELRIAHLEGEAEALRAQLAALEAADEHHRAELAGALADAAEAQASAREATARAEERRHLIDELRAQLEEAKVASPAKDEDEGGRRLNWRGRKSR
jgi:predicted RNase H-like nuclease (RuvC/YqgF family)